ncbi:hypothetical protein C5167_039546 [Papaver somniferum]|uniref:Uncharacterized protein n=1 Tax=Papaver somniferum TaxID=3469 RepID=A0A4Y7IFX2_PAPSO|nr:uncharacterized protein LOC113307941 [Papaver somniferum]RZC46602.1 hypothetical protein C5167_039546 [Papaver somniferum]
MDAKSLARSKRAHTQHHQNKKPHPNQKSKGPLIVTPTEGNTKNPSGKPKSSPFQGSSGLPSNWDRYEDEFESGAELISGGAGAGDDVVKPKSKGADFSYLISEAQSQSSCSLDCFNSFYDALPDFDKAVSSMLSVRGESVLSWIGDDNFVVDDNASSGYEAASLSMDLHALAAQLEKIDISRRLLIEADLLPPELCAGGLDDHISRELEQVQLGISGNTDGHIDVDESTSHNAEAMPPSTLSRSSSSTNDENLVPVIHCKGAELLNPGVDDLQMLDSNLSITMDSMKRAEFCPVPCSEDKAVKFEAAAADAELDTLLDSLGEMDILSSTSSISNYPVANQVNPTFIGGFAAGNSNSQPNSRLGSRSSISRVTMNIDIDDTVDDLLGGTSNMKNHENSVMLPRQEVTSDVLPLAAPSNSASSSHSSSKLLDDFDSWLDTI